MANTLWMITIVAALSLHPLSIDNYSNDCFLQAMVIDWSSSKLLSFHITYHIICLGVHLLMYCHDFVFIRAYIGYLAVTTTPPVDPTVSWRGVVLMALVLIRLSSVPHILRLGDSSSRLVNRLLILFSPRQPHPVITIYRLWHTIFNCSGVRQIIFIILHYMVYIWIIQICFTVTLLVQLTWDIQLKTLTLIIYYKLGVYL